MSQISVIVPVYKVEKYLKRCIDSILAQTFTDYELILVDDGSPDNCGCICDEYAQKDTRIHVIHKSNGGLSDARNAGIEWVLNNCRTKYIAFIDSDDWVHNDYLYVLYKSLLQSGTRVSIVPFLRVSNYFEDNNTFEAEFEICKTEELYCEKKKNFITAWGKLFFLEDFRSIRFPVGKLHEDEYTIYKVLFNSQNVTYINIPLYYYFDNKSGITSNPSIKSWMDQIYSIGEQIAFLENQYPRAFKIAVDTYLRYLGRTYDYLRKTSVNSLECKEVRKMLSESLKKYSISIINSPYYYELLYPKEMKLYWFIKAQKDKLTKK